MALGTGSIRFSQIVSEFGGVSPHRFSEYKSLSGLGVSGVPASGTMRFSQFRGKSNQVSTQVWVSSGYNQTSWTYTGRSISLSRGSSSAYIFTLKAYVGYGGSRWWGETGRVFYYGNYKFVSSSRYKSTDSYYAYNYSKSVSWIDTSAYQTQTTTARIST